MPSFDGELSALAGRRTLIVASTGGHLAQAVRWQERLGLSEDSIFVTFESPQSESLLDDRRHLFVPYVSPRDARGVLRTARELLKLGARNDLEAILSTGAGVALACIPTALAARLPFYYFESVSRFEGPSTTGRILQKFPHVRRGTQHAHWASTRWPYVGSLLDDYHCERPQASRIDARGRRIFVTLGTIRPYRFDRLVDRVVSLLRPEDQVSWQLGATMREGLPGSASKLVSGADFESAARAADVVITQSGVGALLDLLDMGVSPIVVPRRRVHGEHVDDHQVQVAEALHARGLITAIEVGALTRAHLEAPRGVVTRQQAVVNPEGAGHAPAR